MTKKYGYLYGNPKRRKNRSIGWTDKFQRDLHAAASKSLGFRVRLFETGKPRKKRVI